MIDCKCSFSITLIKEDFSCEQAQPVARRAGPDTACASKSGSQRCQQVYAELKAVGLSAFDAEDDLLKTPASVFSKIQFGGLLGIANMLATDDDSVQSKIVSVDNIFQLLERAVVRYESVNNIPYTELVDAMTKFKIKRKR